MNNTDWILSEQEQAEMFPPLVVEPAPETLPSIFQPVFSDAESKPADFYQRTPVQRELFELDPENDSHRADYFKHFSKSIADFFAVQIKKRIKAYGSVYANQWFSEQKAQQINRLQMVMAHYSEALSIFQMPYQDLTAVENLPFAMSQGKNPMPLYWGKRHKESTREFEQRKQARVAEALQIFPTLTERLANSHNTLRQAKLTPLYQMNSKQIKQLADNFAQFISDELNRACDLAMPSVQNSEQAYKTLLGIYNEIAEKVARFKLSLNAVKQETALVTALLKITDPKTWERKFNQMAKKQAEHFRIAVGMVHSSLGGYVSNDRLREFEEQKKANFEFIKNSIIINTLNPEEQHELLDMWLKSSANPKINRIELMTRLRGYEEIADEYGDLGVFVTLTAPSKYHAMLQQGGANPKWNGSSPTMSKDYLNNVWAKIRSAFKREDVPVYGLRVAEPHHDATPHYHFVLWTVPEKMRELKRIMYRYALEEDGDEKGAKRRRCTFKLIDKEKGSATAYVSKYISKNIDALGMDDLLADETGKPAKEAAARAKAWATLWNIRQFQFVGGASVGVWRELRRLGSVKQSNETVDTGRAISDVGCYASYLIFQGGIFALRKDQKLRLHYIDTEPNKYQETRQKVQGVMVQATGETVKTRLKEWVIGKMPKEWKEQKAQERAIAAAQKDIDALEKAGLPALGLVSVTVRGQKNNQISDEARNCIRNELIKMRGRVTEHQIDDLLNGKRLKIWGNSQKTIYLTYNRGQLIEQIVDNQQIN